jgi:hypothetical protein
VNDHRVRLNDDELALVVSALVARRAGVSAERAAQLDKLATRLSEGKRGNPNWIFQWEQLVSETA